jgi:hypothetical protein
MKTPEKIELPKGKLSVKFSQARCVWQMYCGGEYLPLACGGYPTEAIKELLAWYAVPIGTAVTIFGGSSMGKQVVLTTRETPEPESKRDAGETADETSGRSAYNAGILAQPTKDSTDTKNGQ